MLYDFNTIKEVDFDVEFFRDYEMLFVVKNNKLMAYVNGELILECDDVE